MLSSLPSWRIPSKPLQICEQLGVHTRCGPETTWKKVAEKQQTWSCGGQNVWRKRSWSGTMGFTKRFKDRAGLKSLGLFFFLWWMCFSHAFHEIRIPTVIAPKPPTLVFVQGQPSSMQPALCARSSHGTRRVGFVLPERSGLGLSSTRLGWTTHDVPKTGGSCFSLAIGQSGRWARDLDLPLQTPEVKPSCWGRLSWFKKHNLCQKNERNMLYVYVYNKQTAFAQLLWYNL